MIQIRRNVFETNSSSTHTLAVDKSDLDKKNLPEVVNFKMDEFGWEFKSDNSISRYFWTAVVSYIDYYGEIEAHGEAIDLWEAIKIIRKAFAKYGIKTSFDLFPDINVRYERSKEMPDGNSIDCPNFTHSMSYSGDNYIDHVLELNDFLAYLFNNPDNIVQFCLGLNSRVITGNDNESIPDDIESEIEALKSDENIDVFEK